MGGVIKFDNGLWKVSPNIQYLLELFVISSNNQIMSKLLFILFIIKLYARINIKYLISEKFGITDSYYFAGIRTDSHHPLPIEQIMSFHNVIILIKSVVNKNKNSYCDNISLEQGLHKDKSNAEYFKKNVRIL